MALSASSGQSPPKSSRPIAKPSGRKRLVSPGRALLSLVRFWGGCSAVSVALMPVELGQSYLTYLEDSGPLSWRWACKFSIYDDRAKLSEIGQIVFLNLPICAASSIALWCSLSGVNLTKSADVTWSKLWKTFDFLGL